MKKKSVLGLIGVGILSAAVAWAADVYKDQATSSVEITRETAGLTIKTEEAKYLTSYLGDYAKNILVKVVTSLTINTQTEGRQGNSSIEARSAKDNFASVLWTATDQSQEVDYQNDELLRSVNQGCCGEPLRVKLFSVETGMSPATTLNENFFSISVPNSQLPKRYWAQVEDTGAPAQKGNANYVASVGYFHSEALKGLVRFYAQVSPTTGSSLTEAKLVNLAGSKSKNTVIGNELELWDSDGQKDASSAYKEFAFSGQIDFDSQHLKFEIPVNNDQIDAAKIKVDSGLTYDVVVQP